MESLGTGSRNYRVVERQIISSRLASIVSVLGANAATHLSQAGDHVLHFIALYASLLAYATASTRNVLDMAVELQELPYGFLPFNPDVLKELEEQLLRLDSVKRGIWELHLRSKLGHVTLLLSGNAFTTHDRFRLMSC